jgi:hypothetical protein
MNAFHSVLVKVFIGCTVGFVCLNASAQSIEAEQESLSKWPSFLNGAVSCELSPNLPIAWAPEEEAWRLDLTGTGQSSPVAWIDSIYVTTIDGPNKGQCIVTSIDAHSGKKKWEWSIASTAPFENSHYVSRNAPTGGMDLVKSQGILVFPFATSGFRLFPVFRRGSLLRRCCQWRTMLRKADSQRCLLGQSNRCWKSRLLFRKPRKHDGSGSWPRLQGARRDESTVDTVRERESHGWSRWPHSLRHDCVERFAYHAHR